MYDLITFFQLSESLVEDCEVIEDVLLSLALHFLSDCLDIIEFVLHVGTDELLVIF